jgi:hypothetical protein
MSGKQIEKRVAALGLTKAAFSRLANISEPTLNDIFDDIPTVRASSRGKVLRKLAELEAEAQPAVG